MTEREAIEILGRPFFMQEAPKEILDAHRLAISALEKQEQDRWIPVTERLPEVNRDVLLSSNMGNVYAGHRDTTDFIYKVTDKNGRELWVYDPESYTDDIDSLPKTEDCAFDNDECTQGWLSVSSVNYNDRFEGITAWQPLPEPYKAEEDNEG